MKDASPRTLVLLCEHLASAGGGLDLPAIAAWLEAADGAISVRIIERLCERPAGLPGAAEEGFDRLVLGVCAAGLSESELQRGARHAGLDPLGVEVIDLGGWCARVHRRDEATAKSKLLLAAAVARARAFGGSRAEHVVPRFPRMEGRVSRRALLTLPPLRYQPVVSIDRAACFAQSGCRRCIEACPAAALSQSGDRVVLDRARCEACGICVAVCPAGAVELPGASPEQHAAAVAALLAREPSAAPAARAILLICDRNAAAIGRLAERGLDYPAAWLPLRVPCTGALSAADVLGPLPAGAAAVGVVACGGGCPFAQRARAEGVVDYCRELLALLGRSADRVRLVRPAAAEEMAADLNTPIPATAAAAGPLPKTVAAAIVALAPTEDAADALALRHPASPFALVRIEAASCTACGACARACPAGALTFEEDAEEVAITFDHARCVNCGLCAGRCPEAAQNALAVEPVTDIEALRSGRVTLLRDRAVRCEICGAAVGPAAMLDRIEALLGGDLNAATIAAIRRRCPECRASAGALFPGSPPAGP